MFISVIIVYIYCSVERIDWLRDGTVVQSMDFPDDSSGPYRSLFLITSDQMSLEKSGPYFCRVRWTGGPFSADISAGTLTVLGQYNCISTTAYNNYVDCSIQCYSTIRAVSSGDMYCFPSLLSTSYSHSLPLSLQSPVPL